MQVVNVATLPGIVRASYAMPDVHWGYGFPIGGVAATDVDNDGVVSPGGVGFDISCGVRLLVGEGLDREELQPRLPAVMDRLDRAIPRGVGTANVIADDVIWTREWLVDALRVFEGCRVWMVGVHVSDEEGARRELERGDRHPGWNRGSARAAHADAEYDFELDTTATPVHELARELHESYQACPYPMAFNRLRKRFLS